MVRLTNILEKVQGYHPRADTDLINKAYVYASRMHDGQSRKSGDAYFVHPVSVADINAAHTLDASSRMSAMMSATETGWTKYASPDLRDCPSCMREA